MDILFLESLHTDLVIVGIGKNQYIIWGNIATSIHPWAIISSSATIGTDSFIMTESVVGANSNIDHEAIVNTGAVIDHDVIVGGSSHVGVTRRWLAGQRSAHLLFLKHVLLWTFGIFLVFYVEDII